MLSYYQGKLNLMLLFLVG